MRPIPGIVIEVETAETRATPSQVEVNHLWNKTKDDIDKIDQLLGLVLYRLRRMRRWQLRGFVNSIKIEEVQQDYDVLVNWLQRLNELIIDANAQGWELYDNGSGI